MWRSPPGELYLEVRERSTTTFATFVARVLASELTGIDMYKRQSVQSPEYSGASSGQ